MSNSTIKTAKWKTRSGKRKRTQSPSRQPTYGLRLPVEKMINGEFTPLEIWAAPRFRAERSTLSRKVELASFVILKTKLDVQYYDTNKFVEELRGRIGAIAIAAPPSKKGEWGKLPTEVYAFFDDDEAAMLALLTHS